MHTTTTAAAMLNRPARTVKHWCAVHGIGELVGGRRILSDRDIERLKVVAATTVRGNPRLHEARAKRHKK